MKPSLKTSSRQTKFRSIGDRGSNLSVSVMHVSKSVFMSLTLTSFLGGYFGLSVTQKRLRSTSRKARFSRPISDSSFGLSVSQGRFCTSSYETSTCRPIGDSSLVRTTVQFGALTAEVQPTKVSAYQLPRFGYSSSLPMFSASAYR